MAGPSFRTLWRHMPSGDVIRKTMLIEGCPFNVNLFDCDLIEQKTLGGLHYPTYRGGDMSLLVRPSESETHCPAKS